MRMTANDLDAVMALATTGIIYSVYVFVKAFFVKQPQEPEDSDFHPW